MSGVTRPSLFAWKSRSTRLMRNRGCQRWACEPFISSNRRARRGVLHARYVRTRHGILRSWRSAQAHPETPKQREEAMITRVLATFVVVALGIYAFWGDAMGQGHVLNPFGILFLLLAALIWFGWGPICEGFKSTKDESDIPISRLGSTIIKGMIGLKRGPGRRRSDS